MRKFEPDFFAWKYIFQAIFADSFSLDLNVFFEENLQMGLFLLSAIYLHVNKTNYAAPFFSV